MKVVVLDYNRGVVNVFTVPAEDVDKVSYFEEEELYCYFNEKYNLSMETSNCHCMTINKDSVIPKINIY